MLPMSDTILTALFIVAFHRQTTARWIDAGGGDLTKCELSLRGFEIIEALLHALLEEQALSFAYQRFDEAFPDVIAHGKFLSCS